MLEDLYFTYMCRTTQSSLCHCLSYSATTLFWANITALHALHRSHPPNHARFIHHVHQLTFCSAEMCVDSSSFCLEVTHCWLLFWPLAIKYPCACCFSFFVQQRMTTQSVRKGMRPWRKSKSTILNTLMKKTLKPSTSHKCRPPMISDIHTDNAAFPLLRRRMKRKRQRRMQQVQTRKMAVHSALHQALTAGPKMSTAQEAGREAETVVSVPAILVDPHLLLHRHFNTLAIAMKGMTMQRMMKMMMMRSAKVEAQMTLVSLRLVAVKYTHYHEHQD